MVCLKLRSGRAAQVKDKQLQPLVFSSPSSRVRTTSGLDFSRCATVERSTSWHDMTSDLFNTIVFLYESVDTQNVPGWIVGISKKKIMHVIYVLMAKKMVSRALFAD